MASHLELALLSKNAYFRQERIVLGWKRTLSYDKDGLGASVYCNDKGEMVIAFRGTDTVNFTNLLKNLMTNLEILFAQAPSTAAKAKEFVAATRATRGLADKLWELMRHLSFGQVTITGHSLGGIIAGLVGFEFIKIGKKYNVVTFENPGYRHLIPQTELATHANVVKERFITYLSDPNPINTYNPHIGELRRVSIKLQSNNICSKLGHKISYFIDCISNDILRVLLLLIFADIVLSNFFKKNLISDNIMRGLQSLSRHGSNYLNLPEINQRESAQILILLLKFILYTATIKIFNKIILQTQKQHPIDSIIAVLEKVEKGNAVIEIEQWPNFKQYTSSHVSNLLSWINPMNQISLVNYNNYNQLHEHQIKSMEGYQERLKPVK